MRIRNALAGPLMAAHTEAGAASAAGKKPMGSARAADGAPAAAPQDAGAEKPKRLVTRRLNADAAKGQGRTDFWWKHDTEELAGVTDEPKNEALGIISIRIFEPSRNAEDAGIVARVRLESVIGTIDGISIFESTRNPDDIYVSMSGREWKDKQDRKQYARDVKLSRKVEAQILRYVDKLLVPAQAEAPKA